MIEFAHRHPERMARRFARFRREVPPESLEYELVPQDGLCLNVFAIVRAPGEPGRVLFGRLDPAQPWLELAGLGPERVARIGRRWMLPATQLLVLESPDGALRRIGRELLGRELSRLPTPKVFSETYPRTGHAANDPHWDLHFLYDLAWPAGVPLPRAPWAETAFLEVASTPRAEIGRSHADVLDLIGLSAPG